MRVPVKVRGLDYLKSQGDYEYKCYGLLMHDSGLKYFRELLMSRYQRYNNCYITLQHVIYNDDGDDN